MEININCDLGETSKFCSTENDPLLLGIVNSANIACGYHAGDKPTMKRTIEISKKNGVSIGAHPSFNDPDNFGRKRLNLPPLEIKKLIIDQINILNEIAETDSMKVTYINHSSILLRSISQESKKALAYTQHLLRLGKSKNSGPVVADKIRSSTLLISKVLKYFFTLMFGSTCITMSGTTSCSLKYCNE